MEQASRPPLSVEPTATSQQREYSAHSPVGSPTLSTGGEAVETITIQTLLKKYKKGTPITMLTAHDFPSAHAAAMSGVDIVLVGDSLAMVALGMTDTSEVTLDEMLVFSRAVSRGANMASSGSHSFVVGDLPMGSYEINPDQAVQSSIRMIKEGRAHSIKLEGGITMAPAIKRIVNAGVPVLAHVGLTPQRQNALGGFRAQGRSAESAMIVLEDALAVQAAGAWGVVVECVPEAVADIITRHLKIPTIGIGAGNRTSGQVLVQTDMLGNYPPGRFVPRFVKVYGNLWEGVTDAIGRYIDEVKQRAYPAKEHTYPMPEAEVARFEEAAAMRVGKF